MPLRWSNRSTDPVPARSPALGAYLKPLAHALGRVPRTGLDALFEPLVRRQVAAGAPTVPLEHLTPAERAAWNEHGRRERHARLERNRRGRRWRWWRLAGRWLLGGFLGILAMLCAALGNYYMALFALSGLVLHSIDGAFFGAAARRDERLLELYRGLAVVLTVLGVWTVGQSVWGWLT